MSSLAVVCLIAACGVDGPSVASGSAVSAATATPPGANAPGRGLNELPPPAVIAQLPPDGGPEFNRLIFEHSPYLLQHARNPVNWYPWGEEAFEAARRLDRPIFLSVGYSTCHWCHVMEEESFEDEEVARVLNENFIAIKVDREERPDIDNIYMQATVAMTGRGGWPMTVLLTPDRRPFFAGTYFPREDRFGQIGLLTLLPRITDLWQTRRSEVVEVAQGLTAALRDAAAAPGGGEVGRGTLDLAYAQVSSRFDRERGGFGDAPKFPTPHNLLFLLREWHRTGNDQALEMVESTLHSMRRGGIFDHVGFGFHRYSTDRDWLVPHFEKMLYDQALLSIAYLDAYQATGDSFYADTAREIFTYVLRDMRSPEGGFHSAEDADSEGGEGLFYLWTPDEVMGVLGAEEGELFNRVFGIVPGGNFQEIGEAPSGRSIPHLGRPLGDTALALGIPESELRLRIEACRQRLFEVREQRARPPRDDKILTDWNGLMIAALAIGSRVLDEPEYAQAAEEAADFVLAHLRTPEGRLLKRFRGGEAGLQAHLEDYTFFTWGLIELYETTFDTSRLREALDLTRQMSEHFWDDDRGGFFLTADDAEPLLIRPREVYDGAIPSGNSVAALNLMRLGRIIASPELEERAHQTMNAFGEDLARAPVAHTFMMLALEFAVGPSHEIVIAGDPAAEDTQTMLRALRSTYVPNAVVVLRPAGDSVITQLAPYTEPQTSHDGLATAYVCQNYACRAPTTDPNQMLAFLRDSGAPLTAAPSSNKEVPIR